MAFVLWLAAAGKSVQIIREPMLLDRWFWTLLVIAELCLGLLLILGRRDRRVWLLGGLTFLLFAGIAGLKAIRSEADCGCFGVVPINPWATLGLDLVSAVLLLGLRPSTTQPLRQLLVRPGAKGAAMMAASASLAIAVSVALTPAGELGATGDIEGQGSHVVIDPARWVDQPLPLLPYLPAESPLNEGAWEVVLVRPGCPHCLDFLGQYEPSDGYAGAVVSLAAPDQKLRDAAHRLPVYTLDTDRHWYAEVPMTMRLHEGRVTRVMPSHEIPSGRGNAAVEPVAGNPPSDLGDAVWFDESGHADLGYIQPGSEHILAVRIQAPIDRPLSVERIHSECKCTVITEAPDQLARGETGVVSMRFVATDKPLRYNQAVLIQTDHPDAALAQQRLVVTARIGLPLNIYPQRLWVSTHPTHLVVTVTNDGTQPVRLIYAVADAPGVTARVPREPVPAGASVELAVQVDHEHWDGQAVRIRIPTTASEQPDLYIAIEP